MTSDYNYRDRLHQLTCRAEILLQSRREFFTEGTQIALKDLLHQAKLALDDRVKLPFSRNREFLIPRQEEAIQFATKRYTMVPPFAEEGKVYSWYGLEPALEWFEKQDMLYEGANALPLKAANIMETAQELLSKAVLGEGIGEYGTQAGSQLLHSMDELRKETERFDPEEGGEVLARKIVIVFNQLRTFRHSRRLRTDVEPGSALYLSAKAMDELKSSIRSNPRIREHYKEIESWTELYNLADLERVVSDIMENNSNYDELNRHFYLWSYTDKIINFRVPAGALKADISFLLSAEDNEQEGLGHVWIDDIEILTASGNSLGIRNGGFDQGSMSPIHWKAEVLKGQPVLKWETEYPYNGGGKRSSEAANPSSQMALSAENLPRRSLYMCNPTANDEGAWRYDQLFDVEGGMRCTLTFGAKLDGKLKKGLKVLISYMNEQGEPVGEFVYAFNRKSSLTGGRFPLPMQCDAIRYVMTGDTSYAEKTKRAMLYTLHDFCQGAEHWLVTNLRPEGSDSYGAVQGGRLLSVIAVTYSLIRSANVFNASEKKRFYDLVEYMLRYLLDLRDRTEWTPYEAQRGCSNWQTDMCAGTGLMMMVLSDFPNRQTWLNNANTILKAQLELNVNPDGSWPESIRYHHAALERFAGYALVLKNITGEDWFRTTPLLRMFNYAVEVQTPGYRYFAGRIGTPPFGDHVLGGGEEFGYFATYLPVIAEIDRSLADRMFHTWTAAGRPFKRLWGESVVLENLLFQEDHYTSKKNLLLESTSAFSNAGIYIFRKGFGTPKHSYFAIMSSPEPVAHGHLDQGSFVLYKNSVPLVMDSGIEGYFDTSTNWHISSYSHACVQFATRQRSLSRHDDSMINLSAGTYSLERGWVDVPKTSRVLDVQLGSEKESITIEITNPEGEGIHIRHVTYIREPELYIIRDEIVNFEGKVLFNLPVAATQSWIDGSRVYSEGAYEVDLETVFLSPVESITLDQGRCTRFYDREKAGRMDYIRAIADAQKGFVTVLYPKEKGRKKLSVVQETDGSISLVTDDYHVCLDASFNFRNGGQRDTLNSYYGGNQ
ncbi:heparinase II/III domain-containing protein [Paenibacillus xylanexedens]|uniref:heparinase II/III domain-containing protein n=1 Tax=Paenibacillus xylanexedens TaxID=528191 RepID=UPI0011A66DE8|nr:heparinase II/III family protein [Paenibacillus xylanexedens]